MESTEGKIQTIEILQSLLSTEQKPGVFLPTLETLDPIKVRKMNDKNLQQDVTDILMDACKSGNLLLMSHALNGFYEIYSEAFYNPVLVEKGIIPMMKAGLPQVQTLYK